jgi:hypothetical protein
LSAGFILEEELRYRLKKLEGTDAGVFERAESGDVKFRDASHQRVDPVAFAYAQTPERIGEAVGQVTQLREAEISDRAVFAQPPDGRLVAERAGGVAVNRFVRDVETSAARQTVKLAPRLIPGESRPRMLVIPQVRGDPASVRRFDDRFPRHLTPPKIRPRISKRCNYQADPEQLLLMFPLCAKSLTY